MSVPSSARPWSTRRAATGALSHAPYAPEAALQAMSYEFPPSTPPDAPQGVSHNLPSGVPPSLPSMTAESGWPGYSVPAAPTPPVSPYTTRLPGLSPGINPHLHPSLETFQNPFYAGADPWLFQKDGFYYLSQATPHGIEIWKSPGLTQRGQRKVVWTPPRSGWNAAQVWAPEIHFIRNRWYIYYAAADGRQKSRNATHRMGVLESVSADPQGRYIDRGPLYTGDDLAAGQNNRWAIDGTVFEIRGQLYFLWSGWESDHDLQHLYIAAMSDPCTISSNRVRLCDNDTHPWERVGESLHQRGLHEGPTILHRNGRVHLVFSCSASWQHTYKLGLLHMDTGADPMNPASWTKHPEPAFQSSADIFGVGHCSFVQSPDGSEDWMLYHAKTTPRDGWNRVIRAQRFAWNSTGLPEFGIPQAHEEMLLPSGERRTLDPMPPAPDFVRPAA